MRSPIATFFVVGLMAIGEASALVRSASHVLMMINEASFDSVATESTFAETRGLPSEQHLALTLSPSENNERTDYERQIETPLATWLARNFAQDRILYIVLTKDIPLRIAGTNGQTGTVASVDSELTLLYRKLYGATFQLAGSIRNPFFLGDAPAAGAKRFSHRTFDIYLVGRLDGFSVEDVKSMIDRGLSPARQGKVVLDGKLELNESIGNKWLTVAADTMKKIPGWSERVVLDTGLTAVTRQPEVMGFYTW